MDIKLLTMILVIGIMLTIYPYYFYRKQKEAKFIKAFVIFNTVLFIFLILLMIILVYNNIVVIVVLLVIGAAICLTAYRYFYYLEDKGKYRLSLIGLFGLFAILAIIIIFSIYNNDYSSPITFKVTDLAEISLLFAIFAMLNIVLLPRILKAFSPKKFQIGILIILALLVFSFVLIQLRENGVITSHFIETGQLEGMDIFSEFWFQILQDPTVLLVITLMAFGGILKTIDLPASQILGNVIVSWIPTLIWIMIFVGIIPIPDLMVDFFIGFQWFGWFTYVILVAIIFISVIAMITLFTQTAFAVTGLF